MMKKMLGALGMLMMGMVLAVGKPLEALADGSDEETGDDFPIVIEEPDADENDKKKAYSSFIEFLNVLHIKYDFSDAAEEKVNAIIFEANSYIKRTAMKKSELDAYVAGVKGNMAEVVGQGSVYGSTSKFLYLSNEVPVTCGVYSQATRLILSIINLGQENVSNLVITPNVSEDPKKWPFEILTASDVRTISNIKAAPNASMAFDYRMDTYWDFMVRPDVKTGVYPISFHVQYYKGGAMEETDLTTYVRIQGAPGKGNLIEEEKPIEPETNTSVPRLIVTGFTTDPERVMAGDTFNLTITVQNTSQNTAVSNIQFDLAADAVAAGNGEGAYAAFLPTSGSATLYVPYIGAGQTTDISIEMTARNDLSQKPYIVTVKASYEDGKARPYTAESNVSVPVYQEARLQLSNIDIAPGTAGVGESVNVMFDINNLGRTTLYNVQVRFDAETVMGGEAFLGTIDSGKTGNVDTMVDCVSPTMDDGIITAVITYEDEAGNASEYTQELSLYVYEAMDYGDGGMWDDGMWDDGMWDDMGEGEKKFPIWIPIAGAGVLAAIIIPIVCVNASKKRKEKRLAELADADDDL